MKIRYDFSMKTYSKSSTLLTFSRNLLNCLTLLTFLMNIYWSLLIQFISLTKIKFSDPVGNFSGKRFAAHFNVFSPFAVSLCLTSTDLLHFHAFLEFFDAFLRRRKLQNFFFSFYCTLKRLNHIFRFVLGSKLTFFPPHHHHSVINHFIPFDLFFTFFLIKRNIQPFPNICWTCDNAVMFVNCLRLRMRLETYFLFALWGLTTHPHRKYIKKTMNFKKTSTVIFVSATD